MFSFLSPIFLWAAAAASIPLILHLMQRRRVVRVPFSTIRFLKLAQKRSSNRIRMENFILWLLRTLLMLALALAFAMPMARTRSFGKFFGQSRRDVAIVLDGSYSMTYTIARDSAWDKALDTAIEIVNGLKEGDQVCVFMATDDVKPVVEQLTPDREYVTSQLRALTPRTTGSQLAPATLAAYNSLQAETRRHEQELHILTDGQARPWSDFLRAAGTNPPAAAPAAGTNAAAPDPAPDGGEAPDPERRLAVSKWEPAKLNARTAFFVTLTGVPAPENVAPLDLELQPPILMSGAPSQVKVKVGRSGSVQNSAVSLSVDESEKGNRAALFGQEDVADVVFALPPLPPGIHPAWVETPADNLALDNRFHFLVRVRESLPVLCVGTTEDALFLAKALNPRADAPSGVAVKAVETDALAGEDLAAYASVILCNAIPLPGQALLALEQYVKNGGLLVVFPGDRAAVADYAAWSCLPGLPSAIADIPMTDRKKILRWERPQHPVLRALRVGPGGAPVITVRRELRWEKREKTAQVLILAGAETPFLMARPFGKGQVLLFSVAADRTWSTLPLSAFFLPIVQQVVQFGAGITGAEPYLWATHSLSLADHLPAATQGSTLSDPDGNAVSVRSSMVDNRPMLRAEDVMAPGLYKLTKPGEAQPAPALAINVDRGESDLAPIKRERIPDTLGIKSATVASGKDELLRLVHDHRVGKTLGEAILWLALLLSVLEIFYANRKSRVAQPLSEALGVEASGKVAPGGGGGSGATGAGGGVET